MSTGSSLFLKHQGRLRNGEIGFGTDRMSQKIRLGAQELVSSPRVRVPATTPSCHRTELIQVTSLWVWSRGCLLKLGLLPEEIYLHRPLFPDVPVGGLRQKASASSPHPQSPSCQSLGFWNGLIALNPIVSVLRGEQ